MRILAIRLARFGDIVLLLPALTLLKEWVPDSHLTFLTDTRWGPLAAMCPAVDEILTIDRLALRDGRFWRSGATIWRLFAGLRQRRFDAVIDCHGFRETNLLSWSTGASRRLGLRRFDQSFLPFCFNMPPVVEDKTLHVSEMFLRVAQSFVQATPAARPSQPSLVVPLAELDWVRENLPASPFAVLYVDAPVTERMWPLDRFAAVARHIVTNLHASVVVVSGSSQVSANFPEGVPILVNPPIPRLAAIIASARMLVSNDTGPMHLGPAFGTPTVAIFSVGFPAHFRPTGVRDRYIQGNPIGQVGLEEVIGVIGDVWKSSYLSDR